MIDIQSATAENRLGKKGRRKKPQLQNIMASPLLWVAIKERWFYWYFDIFMNKSM